MLPNDQNHWKSDILSLSMLFLVFYFLWLGSYPLFTPDEGRYAEAAREMLVTGDFITPHVNGIPFLDKPVLYYWLQALSMAAFGVNEWAIRLVPVLSGLLGCIMLYICGRHLFNRQTALLSVSILATSPLYYGGAHYANLDLEVAVWISSTLLCIITAMVSDGKTRSSFMLAAYVFAALAFLTKGLIGIVFPGLITLLWMGLKRRFDLLLKLRIPLGMILFLIITLPWYVAAQHANPDFFHYFFITQQFSRFVSAGDYNNQAALWFYLPVIAAGFFPWTLFALPAIYRACKNSLQDKTENRAELFLLIWLTVVVIFFSIPHSKIVGYILPVFPALALLTGHYITQLLETENISSLRNMTGLFILLCTGVAITFFSLAYFQHGDFIQQAKYLFLALGNIQQAFAVLALVLLVSNRFSIRKLFMLCIAMSTLSLLIIVSHADQLNMNSTKTLTEHLKLIATPQHDIIHYYKFYQDVPLYMQRKVTLVANWDAPDIADHDNWVREAWLGRNAPEARNILMHEDTFWERWKSKQRVFVFLNENYFTQFKMHAAHYFVIGTSHDILLLSNQPSIE